MIHFYLGSDTQYARMKAREYFEHIRNENPSSHVSYFDDILFDLRLATEAFNGESLFGGRNIMYFDGILEHSEGEVFYRTILKETDHDVIIREASLSKDLLGFFERLGEIKDFTIKKPVEKRMTSFAITDALGARDKKMSWVEFEKVRRDGGVMEEVHGTIFWGYKSMLMATLLNKQDALRGGMKEYTYRTYSDYAKNYKESELKDKIKELKEIYHKGHRGEGDMENMLELFILKN